MSDILFDLSRPRLVTAIEINLSAWIPVFGKLGQAIVDNPNGVKRSITDLPIALFNSIMDARLAEEQVESAIQTIINDARARKVPVLWWIGPSTSPAGLAGDLIRFGFSLDDEGPGMAVDLACLNENVSAPAGFSIQAALDEPAWRLWSRVTLAGFGSSPPPEFAVQAWSNLLSQTDLDQAQPYIGWLQDEPVATSLLFLAGGVAGVYAVATIPEARRKGIGAWMTLFPLQQARLRGYKAGILQASDMGVSVYRQLGFQEYCKINTYRWSPEKATT